MHVSVKCPNCGEWVSIEIYSIDAHIEDDGQVIIDSFDLEPGEDTCSNCGMKFFT